MVIQKNKYTKLKVIPSEVIRKQGESFVKPDVDYDSQIPIYYDKYWLNRKLSKIYIMEQDKDSSSEEDQSSSEDSDSYVSCSINPDILKKDFAKEDMNLIGFNDNFRDIQIRERVMDKHVLTDERVQIEQIEKQLVNVFLNYIKYLRTPLDTEDSNIDEIIENSDLVDNFFQQSLITKINGELSGYKYQYSDETEDSEISIEIMEIMHLKGLQIVRELNLPSLDIIISNNDYNRGLMEYKYNDIKTHT
jgi:hypothetical protein